MKSDLKLALIQMAVIGGDKHANLLRAARLISEASAAGADIALLPETFDLGWTHPSSLKEAESIPGGRPYQMLVEAAATSGIMVCAGLTELDEGVVYNCAVLIDHDGKLLCKHRKLNELTIGHEFYAQGDRLNVVETDYGRIGLMICADGFAEGETLSRALGYMGAGLILSPSAWAVKADHDHAKTPYGERWRSVYSPVARDFSMWIASVSNVGRISDGPWEGRNCIGCSMVIGPDGQERLFGPYGMDAEEILLTDVEVLDRPTRGTGWSELWANRNK